ncbi:MAG: hypothetical protein LBU24_00090 [Methanocalculaceae archaeon]|nr:hypothetical protein [Methanocalculaceae archaeon]
MVAAIDTGRNLILTTSESADHTIYWTGESTSHKTSRFTVAGGRLMMQADGGFSLTPDRGSSTNNIPNCVEL